MLIGQNHISRFHFARSNIYSMILGVIANLLPEDPALIPMDGINKLVGAVPKKHLLHIDTTPLHGWYRLKAVLNRPSLHHDTRGKEEDAHGHWLLRYLVDRWNTVANGPHEDGSTLHAQALSIGRVFALLQDVDHQRHFIRLVLQDLHNKLSSGNNDHNV